MGISIDVNTYLLFRMFNISPQKLDNEYSGMTIEEIMEEEAKKGNAAAAHFDSAVLTNPVKLIELFELKDPSNKYAILSNLNERDLDELLPSLEDKDLIYSLNYFKKDKILEMMKDLPKEELVNMTFQMFSPEQLIQYMPDEQLNLALTSTDMDKNLEIKCLAAVKPEILAQMYEAATGEKAAGTEQIGMNGQPQNLNPQALIDQISALPDDKFQDAMLSMPKQTKRNFLLLMSKDDPKIFLMFESDAYVKLIGQRKEKQDIVRSAEVLSQESLLKMVTQLPQELKAITLTQIDTTKFADKLIEDFKNVLQSLMA